MLIYECGGRPFGNGSLIDWEGVDGNKGGERSRREDGRDRGAIISIMQQIRGESWRKMEYAPFTVWSRSRAKDAKRSAA